MPSTPSTPSAIEVAWRRGVLAWGLLTLAFGGALIVALTRSGVEAPMAPPVDAMAADAAPPVDASPVACASFTACDASCSTGDLAACVTAADQLRSGRGAPADPAAAMVRYRDLCHQHREPLACTRLALIEDLADERGFATDWVDRAQRPAARLRTACATGDPRGRLACAAEVLAGAAATSADLCGDPAAPRACAQAIALRACYDDRNPEACALAVATPTAADPAVVMLGTLCDQIQPDRAACFYLAAHTAVVEVRDRALLRACPEVDHDPTQGNALAAACRQRATLSTIPTRVAELNARACGAGWCLGQPLKTNAERLRARPVFETACTAARVSGCAHLLYLDRQESSSLWNRQVARATALAPAAPTFLDVPPKVARLVAACQLGAAVGCDAASNYLAAHAGATLAVHLQELASTLRDPVPGLTLAAPRLP